MKGLMVSVGAVVLGVLLSSAPVTAQNQGNGPEALNFCKALVTVCANPNALGSCVSTGNVCLNAAKTGNKDLFALCCEKCFAAAAGCETDPVICTALFGCVP
jgi:hypothetical protein